MEMDENSTPKEWLAARISNNIENQEWDKLIVALPTAEEQGVSIDLLEKGWTLSGDYLFQKSEWSGAVLAYNKAKKLNPRMVYVYDKIIESIDRFYINNKELFGKDDLLKLVPTIQSLIDFYYTHFGRTDSVQKGNELIQKINYRIEFVAKDAVETAVSFRVGQIVDALDKDVPMQQVHQDIAKILLPLIRKKLKQSERKNDDKK